ncbi:MAG: DUF502 domain-containing protein [Candidatus Eisenbacteria bacterium]|jgi:uncharacterized membrane protein|nr:DUF502 domain-containing protein [Candidatus Eisenbacteria bacterium]
MGLRRTLHTSLIAGVLVLVPAVVSIYVFMQLFMMLDRPLGTALFLLTGMRIPGVGFAALLLLIMVTGLFTRNLVGSQLVKLARGALSSVPLLGKLYGVLEQTLTMILSGRGRGFRRVVLVEYPVGGIWSVGFVAGEGGLLADAEGESLTRVFVPTSPNPTTGFVLLVPPGRLRETPVAVEDALRMIVSGGLVLPRGGHDALPEEPPAVPSVEFPPPRPG